MLGARIAKLRRRIGMSQRQLADTLGVSPSAVGMYEQDRREPSLEKLLRLAELLHVPVGYLLTGRPEAPDDPAALAAWYRELERAADGLTILRADGSTGPLTDEAAFLAAALTGED